MLRQSKTLWSISADTHWLLGEDYATAEVRFGKSAHRAKEGLHDLRINEKFSSVTDSTVISAVRSFIKMQF